MGNEIIFTERKDWSQQHLVKNIKGIQNSIKIKMDGLHQADIIKVQKK